MTFEPRMSAEVAERLRRWHQRAYVEGREEGNEGQRFEYLGLVRDVPADVMPISRVSRLLGEAVVDEVKPNDRVFDPPFRWFAPRDRLEMAMTDENYRALTAFFTQVRDFLTSASLIALSTTG